MNDATRVIKPAAEELPTELVELVRVVGDLPPESRLKLEALVGRVVESTKRRRRIMNLVQEALSQLRLDMKYLLFDLEATRRERAARRTTEQEADRAARENLRDSFYRMLLGQETPRK